MNFYKTSTGERVSKPQIDRKVREAKATALASQLEDFGYNFCVTCKRSSGVILDCAHVVSVNDCQKNGKSELAWDTKNIKIMCRNCHAEYDKNNVKWTNS